MSDKLTGGCHCGAVRYEIDGAAHFTALCHCVDCRRAAGAPTVGWMMLDEGSVRVGGETTTYASSEHGRRSFCPACGTGLFYRNAQTFPGLIDVQTATLDDPDAAAPGLQMQVADRIGWMATAHDLPAFDRYPPLG